MPGETPKDQPKTRGKRGGQRARKQAALHERFLRWEFIPKAFAKAKVAQSVVVEDSGSAVDVFEWNRGYSGSAVGLTPPPRVAGSAGGHSSSSIAAVPIAPSVPSPALLITPSSSASVPSVPLPSIALASPSSGSFTSHPPPKGLGSAVSVTPPKAPVTSPKNLVAESNGPPKTKARLTEETRLAPQPGLPKVLAPALGLGGSTLRVCLDFHGVVDVERSGQPSYPGIRTPVQNFIAAFLEESNSHRIGICSYIGLGGRFSGQRRLDAQRSVQQLNQFLTLKNLPPGCLCITDQKDKPELTRDSVSSHCDDKWEVVNTCERRGGFLAVWFNRYNQVNFLSDYFDLVKRNCVPRVFPQAWWPIP